MKTLLRGEANFNFVGKMRSFGILSAVLVLGSITLTAVRGLNFGIDFAGGYEIQASFPQGVSEAKLKELLAPVGLPDARVQRFGEEGSNEYLISVRKHGAMTEEAKKKLHRAVIQLAGGEEKLSTWSVAESGESLTLGFSEAVSTAQVRATLEGQGLSVKDISGGERVDRPLYKVSLVALTDHVKGALAKGLSLPEGFDPVKRVEFVGPQVGSQLRNQGIMAILWALFFILLYIGVRFDLYFSPGAIIALVHDVSIMVGVFALLQLEFNLPIIAAILAIVGYSLNDTIVVYDRIRENTIRLRGRDLRGMVNTSLNQTISRTLLTSLTTLLVVTALLIFGGGIIRDFSVALLVGVMVGTYSSMAIASPVYILLRERYSARQGTRSESNSSSSSTAIAS